MSDSPQYWGGSSLQTTGEVRRLQARTFKQLEERYISTPVPLPYTRAEFLAHPDRDKVKDCAFLSPVSYPYEESGPRKLTNAEKLLLAFLDIDEDPRPEYYDIVRDLASDPKAILEALYPLNTAVWTSAKHTEKNPRLKICVELTPCDPAELPRIIRHLAARLGLPQDFKGVAESSRPSQGQYRPVIWKGEPFSAVLATRTNGVALEVGDIPEEAPEDLCDFLGERPGFTHGETPEAGLVLAHLPVAGVESVDQIRDVFEHLDADCTRMEWLHVAAALRHQFGHDPAQAEEAYDLFVEWSAQGTKFRGTNDTAKMWRSLRAYPEGRAPVTMRSLFKRAQDAGWDGGTIARREKESVTAWITACEDAEELMRAGPANIAAMAVRNAMVEDYLITAIQKRIKELTGDRIEKRAICLEIVRERKRERVKAAEADKRPDMPNWLRPFCYVASTREYFDFGTGIGLSPGAFDDYFSRELMPPDPADQPADGKPVCLPTNFARNLIRIPQVYERMYCPLHGGEDPFFEWEGRVYLNTYNPLSVPVADPEHAEEAGALFCEHIAQLVGEPELREVVLDYLAAPVQFPGRKMPWAPCLQSAEGVGKNFLAEIMGAVLGEVNVKVVTSEVQRSQWNDWWCESLFNVLNEIHHPGEMREKSMNLLKPMISDPVITINKRNTTAACRVPNFTNAIGFTNYHDALHLKESSRRWMMIMSPIQTAEDVARLKDSGHFDRVAILKKEWAPALRYWLLKRKIAPDFPWHGPPPTTKYTRAVIEGSKNPLQEAIEDTLEDGDPLFGWDVLSQAHLSGALSPEAKRNAAKLGHYLTLLGFERLPERPKIGGLRTYLWVHRENYNAMLGEPLELLEWRLREHGEVI